MLFFMVPTFSLLAGHGSKLTPNNKESHPPFLHREPEDAAHPSPSRARSLPPRASADPIGYHEPLRTTWHITSVRDRKIPLRFSTNMAQ
uniref:Secreted protein n=1 Tax=Ficus carica TaxID=3494 RepID=A0AA87ZP58_FICCA|nr:hypothetical protein TIFTF001_042571 [Ficus carica]GMN37070.1 hypothetical protein TIFTF001_042574 [Ficus carica]